MTGTAILLGSDVRDAVERYEAIEGLAWGHYLGARHAAHGFVGQGELWLAASRRRRAEIEAARLDLAEAVRHDRLALWIVENPMRDHPNEAIAVLRRFPTTRAGLDSLALLDGWCGEFERWVRRAADEGVL